MFLKKRYIIEGRRGVRVVRIGFVYRSRGFRDNTFNASVRDKKNQTIKTTTVLRSAVRYLDIGQNERYF